MGFYERVVFPKVADVAMSSGSMKKLRAETLAPAHGEVLEIGLGSGLNAPFYPAAVTRLVGVEPSEGMLAHARDRIAATPFPVELIVAPAESLPFPDASFDTVVSTFTLCSVADPAAVLAELRRVLRPGGAFLVCEHGLSPDAGVARWQRRLDPIQGVVACGCHLTRPVQGMVEAAGFRFDTVRSAYLKGTPRFLGWVTLGAASAG